MAQTSNCREEKYVGRNVSETADRVKGSCSDQPLYQPP